MALFLAARDPRTPLAAKLLAGAVAAYALSPIDLIPDFIPLLGLLDDLLLVPTGIWLAKRMIPPPLLAEYRARSLRDVRTSRPNAWVLVGIVGVWLVAAAALATWLMP